MPGSLCRIDMQATAKSRFPFQLAGECGSSRIFESESWTQSNLLWRHLELVLGGCRSNHRFAYFPPSCQTQLAPLWFGTTARKGRLDNRSRYWHLSRSDRVFERVAAQVLTKP